jgi:hypothetical protein
MKGRKVRTNGQATGGFCARTATFLKPKRQTYEEYGAASETELDLRVPTAEDCLVPASDRHSLVVPLPRPSLP